MEDKVLEEKQRATDEKIDDHEARIRELEKNQTEQRILSMEIQRSQSELKTLILDNDKKSRERNDKIQEKLEKYQDKADKSQDKMDKVLETALEVFKNNAKTNEDIKKEDSKTNNEVKVNRNKQIWITIGSIVTALCAIAVAIFK